MAILLLFNIQPITAQEVSFPDTPVGKMAKAYFTAFNQEDLKAMREFTANKRTKSALTRVSLEDRMAQHAQMKGMIKQMNVKKITREESGHLTFLVFSEAIETWFSVGFTLNDDNPSLLESLALRPAEAPEPESSSVVLPNTPAGKMAKAYFAAFNETDIQTMREFTAQHRTEASLTRVSLDDRMAQHGQIKGMLQKLELKSITKTEEKNLVVLVFSEPVQSWFEIGFTLNDETPPKLEGFALKPVSAPEEGEDIGYGEWNDLSSLLDNVIEKHGIPGLSMAVIKDGKIADAAVAGRHQMNKETPVTANNRFHLGSITKSMTATLIGKLIQKGKLKPEATLKSIFPDINMLPAYESVTVEQLLNHTAGIPGYLTVTDEEEAKLLTLPGNASQQRLAFANKVLREEPMTTPGTAFAYSNAGYSLLGTITEKITGKSWEAQLQKEIFGPLKMKTAGIGWPKAAGRLDQPSGHFGALNELRPQTINEYPLGAYIDPAGDVHASMEDLAKFALAHMNGLNGKNGILNSETFKWLHTTKDKRNYASGWFVNKAENGQMVHEHAGSAGTFLALMIIEPETNQGFVIAANAGGLALDGIFRKVIALYRSK